MAFALFSDCICSLCHSRIPCEDLGPCRPAVDSPGRMLFVFPDPQDFTGAAQTLVCSVMLCGWRLSSRTTLDLSSANGKPKHAAFPSVLRFSV